MKNSENNLENPEGRQSLPHYAAELNLYPYDFVPLLKQLSLENKVPILQEQVGLLIGLLCRAAGCRHVLEIGTGFGFSTVYLLKALSDLRDENQLKPAPTLLSIDSNLDRIMITGSFLNSRLPKEDYAMLELKHKNIFDELPDKKEAFDFILLDSTKKEYPELLELCLSALKPSGLMIADNVFFRGYPAMDPSSVPKKYIAGSEALRRFNAAFAKHRQLQSIFLDFADGLAIARKKP